MSCFPERYNVSVNSWHFMALSYDYHTQKVIMVLDEKVERFDTPGALLWDDVSGPPYKVMVGGNRAEKMYNFRGSISCVQFFDRAFTEAEIYANRACDKTASKLKETLCPKDFTYYDGACYWVSNEPADFYKAELDCMPFPVNSPYKKQMMWSDQRLHLDFVARLVKKKHNRYDYWVGLDNREGKTNWTTR